MSATNHVQDSGDTVTPRMTDIEHLIQSEAHFYTLLKEKGIQIVVVRLHEYTGMRKCPLQILLIYDTSECMMSCALYLDIRLKIFP